MKREVSAKLAAGIFFAVFHSFLVGCGSVAPYERGNLAHPSMAMAEPFATEFDGHVRDVSEGAVGGVGSAGGGCGCN